MLRITGDQHRIIFENSDRFTWELADNGQLLVSFQSEDGTYEKYLWDYSVSRYELTIGHVIYAKRR